MPVTSKGGETESNGTVPPLGERAAGGELRSGDVVGRVPIQGLRCGTVGVLAMTGQVTERSGKEKFLEMGREALA